MTKEQRLCIYCGGPGLSKEHLYPHWMRHYIPRVLAEHGVEYGTVYPDGVSKVVEWRAGDTHSRTIKRVCKSCNSGWMSRLQQAAKPILVPMLMGEAIKLDRRLQKTLAASFAMTCMTAEFLNPDMVAIPQCDRDFLREHGKVPRHWRIWIARYESTQRLWCWNHRSIALGEEDMDRTKIGTAAPSNSQTTTMCIGNHLLVHAIINPSISNCTVRRHI